MWKANGKTTTFQLFLESLSPKTLSLEEAMDLSRDRNELLFTDVYHEVRVQVTRYRQVNTIKRVDNM
jgi:hypothetical protein